MRINIDFGTGPFFFSFFQHLLSNWSATVGGTMLRTGDLGEIEQNNPLQGAYSLAGETEPHQITALMNT